MSHRMSRFTSRRRRRTAGGTTGPGTQRLQPHPVCEWTMSLVYYVPLRPPDHARAVTG